MANDRLHLELRLAPHFVHCIPMSGQHSPGQALVMSVGRQASEEGFPLLAWLDAPHPYSGDHTDLEMGQAVLQGKVPAPLRVSQ